MHRERTRASLLTLCLVVAGCGSSGQGAATADAAAVQDVVDAGDVAADAGDAAVGGDGDAAVLDVPDVLDVAVADVPDAAIPDVPADTGFADLGPLASWIDSNLTEPSDDCSGDAVYPPDGTTLLLDVGPLLPANVVTGCGKGPPQPVSFGSECCDCPPPYSCYCNGECGWLRGPDLKVPQSTGKAVWTGKWVVSVRVLSQIVSGKWQNTLEGQRWDPSGGGGWESIPFPTTPINDVLEVAPLGGKVYFKTLDMAYAMIALVYDPDANVFKNWKGYSWLRNPEMAAVGDKMVEIGPTSKNDYLNGALWLYDPAADSWAQAPFPSALLPSDGGLTQGVLLGDAKSAYLYDCAVGGENSPFPDGTFTSNVGHILKFDLATAAWADIGLVPADWRWDVVQSANVRPDGSIIVGKLAIGTGMQFARIKGGKWEYGVASEGWQTSDSLRSIDTPCGAVLGSTEFGYGSGPLDFLYRVKLVRDDLSVEFPSVWGQPSGAGMGLAFTQLVAIPGNVLVIGGQSDQHHRATYRFPISELCK